MGQTSSVLLVVDVQNDFCPGGALGVDEGDQIVPLINRLRAHFDRVIFTQDWHPEGHLSFAASHSGKKVGEEIDLGGIRQKLWPVHCVQGSWGAQLHRLLLVYPQDKLFKKGTDPRVDSYSAFYDNGHRKSTGLAEFLRGTGVREVTICGLATDYCVRYSVMDALEEEFRVNVIVEACRGVNASPGDSQKALEEMSAAGAHLIHATEEKETEEE